MVPLDAGASRAAGSRASRSRRSAGSSSRRSRARSSGARRRARCAGRRRRSSHVGEFASSKSAMKTLRARVERVDHHLALDRPGDLDAPVVQVGRGGRDTPSPPTRAVSESAGRPRRAPLALRPRREQPLALAARARGGGARRTRAPPSRARRAGRAHDRHGIGAELRLLGRARERERRVASAGDRLRHAVEVAGADLALVPRGRVAVAPRARTRAPGARRTRSSRSPRSRARARTSPAFSEWKPASVMNWNR